MNWRRTDDFSNYYWIDEDRVYEISGGPHGCTLYFDGRNIGGYTTIAGAKRAAKRFEDNGRTRFGRPSRY